ncbi:alanine racemase [Lactobacillus sp. DCY120]|uniref:Alanine racemase n=1 Tax=Bombilactobacillus apium TaxID=2675299 RepID=A0A850RAE0_9LACO|nr:alanine racemase [Bombilactobacillus apium]NVY96326.1 alanine racemase [Bombilactobacillus apium]
MEASNHRPTKMVIDRQALRHNFLQEKHSLKPETKLFAVLKADAYSHGVLAVAQVLHEVHVDGFCVATLDEALQIRQAGFPETILVLGVTPVSQANLASQNDISLAVSSCDWLRQVGSQLTTSLKVHLALDTGMGRIGLRTRTEVLEACQLLQADSQLIPEGIFTHFATANEPDTHYLEQQIQSFQELTADLPLKFEYRHCANSATALWHSKWQFDMVRFGIALYGLNPSNEVIKEVPYQLQPVLSLETEIVYIKQMTAGQKISYGATYTAQENEIIATLPFGYADGWLRRMTGSSVLVEGQLCPIVGDICMDQMMIKVPQLYPLGTKVTIIGENNGHRLSATDAAHYAGTGNYEIVCNLTDRISKKYVN